MVDNLPDNFKAAYNNDREVLYGEAVAEFVRHFITNEVGARSFAGAEFYDWFVQGLSKQDASTLENLKTALASYVAADANTQVLSGIHSYSAKIGQSDLSLVDKVKTNLFDMYHPLRMVDQEIQQKLADMGKASKEYLGVEGLAKNSIYASNTAEQLVTGHMFAPSGETITGVGSLSDALSGIKGRDGYNDLITYMVQKHALADWDVQGKTVFPERISKDAVAAAIAKTERERPDIVATQKNIMRFWETFMQSWVVDEGFLSQNTYNSWKEKNPNYVPLSRVIQKQAARFGQR